MSHLKADRKGDRPERKSCSLFDIKKQKECRVMPKKIFKNMPLCKAQIWFYFKLILRQRGLCNRESYVCLIRQDGWDQLCQTKNRCRQIYILACWKAEAIWNPTLLLMLHVSLLVLYLNCSVFKYTLAAWFYECLSASRSSTSLQTEISQQLLEWVSWNIAQPLMSPGGWTLMTLAISWLSTSAIIR